MQNKTEDLRNLRKTIGNNIHKERALRKVTLARLSRLTGIRMKKLDQYELGKNMVRLEEVFFIARSLGVAAEKLFEAGN